MFKNYVVSIKSNYAVFIPLGDSPTSEYYMPTFRNTLSVPLP